MQKYSKGFFSLLWNPNLTAITITKLVQMISMLDLGILSMSAISHVADYSKLMS